MFSHIQFEPSRNPSDNFFVNISTSAGGIKASLTTLSSDLAKDSLNELGRIIGEPRLKRILERDTIRQNRDDFSSGRKQLTLGLFRKIILEMSEVRIEDHLEHPDRANPFDLRPFNDGNRTDPFDMNLVTLQHVETNDRAQTSGKGIQGLKERLWIAENHRSNELADIEMMTSRFGDREPPIGTIVHLKEGFYFAERIFSAGGAYVTAWKPMFGKEIPHILVCRGTASRRTATGGTLSVINDINPQLGLHGVKSIWPALKEYLNTQKVQKVHIMGKSLGGSHAQYLTPLIAGLTDTEVCNLTTFCSTGAENTSKVIKRIIAEKKISGPDVKIYRNKGSIAQKDFDGVIFVGGKHLSVKDQTEVFDITPKNSAFEETPRGFWAKVFILLKSFGKAHLRQNTLVGYEITEINDIKTALREGRQLESVRKVISWVFTVFTGGYFGSQNFEEFYNSEAAKARSSL